MAGVSDFENKHIIRQWLLDHEDDFKTVLDIGAGVGTYSLMGRMPSQHWTALEVFEPYVEMFNLENKYNEVIVEDARTHEYKDYDLIIAADMIEHMEKEDAKTLIKKLIEHSKTLLICFPVIHHDQHAGAEGNDFETHVDHWDVEEMDDFLADNDFTSIVGEVCAYYHVSKP